MLDTTTTLADVLYPPIEPHTTGMLAVSAMHTLAWEQSGNPDGIPVVVIPGGPGGGGPGGGPPGTGGGPRGTGGGPPGTGGGPDGTGGGPDGLATQ